MTYMICHKVYDIRYYLGLLNKFAIIPVLITYLISSLGVSC